MENGRDVRDFEAGVLRGNKCNLLYGNSAGSFIPLTADLLVDHWHSSLVSE
jgi:hypothetical protein